METAKNDKNEIMVNCVNKKLVAAIKKLKMEIQRRIEHERELQKASQPSRKGTRFCNHLQGHRRKHTDGLASKDLRITTFSGKMP